LQLLSGESTQEGGTEMGRLKTLPLRIKAHDGRTIRPVHAVGDVFYDSPEWRELVREVIRERGRRCEACGASSGRIYTDHIVEIRDGGARLDRGNLKLLCASCHGSKTASARAARAARRW